MTKKLSSFLILSLLVTFLVACNASDEAKNMVEPRVSQMVTISELAAMECYYHNVAKFFDEDAEGILLWKKDKHFWVDYSGVVTIGIDASLLEVTVEDDLVTISMPKAKVLDNKVDEKSLTKENFIIAQNSAKITAEDEVKAFTEAQKQMVEAATNDKALLASAEQRVQMLLEEYVNNIGDAIGKTYRIEWEVAN